MKKFVYLRITSYFLMVWGNENASMNKLFRMYLADIHLEFSFMEIQIFCYLIAQYILWSRNGVFQHNFESFIFFILEKYEYWLRYSKKLIEFIKRSNQSDMTDYFTICLNTASHSNYWKPVGSMFMWFIFVPKLPYHT